MSEKELSANWTDRPGPGYEAPGRARFCSIEEMQAASEAAGWSIDYRQIQSGRMTASSVAGECAGISLLDEGASQRLEVVGETPEGHVTILVPWGRAGLWVNGTSFDNRGIFLLGSRAEMHAVTEEHVRVLSMHIPTSLLQTTRHPVFWTADMYLRNPAVLVEPSPASVERLKRLMNATIYRPVAGRWQVARASGLATALAATINDGAGTRGEDTHSSRAECLRIIGRAREFIEAHLAEPIRIGQVCGYCETSLSKLERTFRRELRISPSQYILVRRLAAVNRELKRADGDSKAIARVAMDHGFSHLGRFSGAYRIQFGELPSETLRSA